MSPAATSVNSLVKDTGSLNIEAKLPAAQLRSLLAQKNEIVICPGVYDGLTARIALEAGFGCLYMTGAGTTASLLGAPDLALLSLTEMLGNASRIARIASSNTSAAGARKQVPLIADADTGFGSVLSIRRTVQEYINANIAAFHIEDQVSTSKRCGHLDNKEVISQEEWRSRIRAAVLARHEANDISGGVGGDIVIIARTDALATHGFEEAIKRLKIAAQEGVDVVFLEGLRDRSQMQNVTKIFGELGVPVLLNLVQGGLTPEVSIEEAKTMGFRIVIYPCWAMNVVLKYVREAAKCLKETGKEMETGLRIRDIFDVCGVLDCVDFAARVADEKGSYAAGV